MWEKGKWHHRIDGCVKTPYRDSRGSALCTQCCVVVCKYWVTCLTCRTHDTVINVIGSSLACATLTTVSRNYCISNNTSTVLWLWKLKRDIFHTLCSTRCFMFNDSTNVCHILSILKRIAANYYYFTKYKPAR